MARFNLSIVPAVVVALIAVPAAPRAQTPNPTAAQTAKAQPGGKLNVLAPNRKRFVLACSILALGAAIACAQSANGPAGAPLTPQPGYIIGRALFEDGRPIPEFTVSAESGFGPAGKAQGSAGRYSIHVTNSGIFIVQNIIAKAVISYQGQTYVLPLHPVDGLPDGAAADNFRGDVTKGVVRDFVFRLTGIAPGRQTNPPPQNVTDTDSVSARASFEGCQMMIEFARETAELVNGAAVQITLTPSGPLIDGSTGRTITRAIAKANPDSSYYFYDIPLGVYTAVVTVTGTGTAARPLHVRMSAPGTDATSGPDPLASVAVSWPFDRKYEQLARPVLTILP